MIISLPWCTFPNAYLTIIPPSLLAIETTKPRSWEITITKEQSERDIERTKIVNQHGIKEIKFTNQEVIKNLNFVTQQIKNELSNQ